MKAFSTPGVPPFVLGAQFVGSLPYPAGSIRDIDEPKPSACGGQGSESAYSTFSTRIIGTNPSGSGEPGRYNSSDSPLFAKLPVNGPKIRMLGSIPCSLRKTTGSTGTTSTCSSTARATPVGKTKSTPSKNAHVFAGLAGSNNSVGDDSIFSSSIYS